MAKKTKQKKKKKTPQSDPVTEDPHSGDIGWACTYATISSTFRGGPGHGPAERATSHDANQHRTLHKVLFIPRKKERRRRKGFSRRDFLDLQYIELRNNFRDFS